MTLDLPWLFVLLGGAFGFVEPRAAAVMLIMCAGLFAKTVRNATGGTHIRLSCLQRSIWRTSGCSN